MVYVPLRVPSWPPTEAARLPAGVGGGRTVTRPARTGVAAGRRIGRTRRNFHGKAARHWRSPWPSPTGPSTCRRSSPRPGLYSRRSCSRTAIAAASRRVGRRRLPPSRTRTSESSRSACGRRSTTRRRSAQWRAGRAGRTSRAQRPPSSSSISRPSASSSRTSTSSRTARFSPRTSRQPSRPSQPGWPRRPRPTRLLRSASSHRAPSTRTGSTGRSPRRGS